MRKPLLIPCQGKYLRCYFTIIEYESEPIVMVMQDDYDHLYLSLCSELRGMRRWVIAPTRIETIRRLIHFEITINDALRDNSKFAYVIEKHGREYTDCKLTFDGLLRSYLAEEGVYADFIEDDCEERLEELEHDISINSQGYFVDSFMRGTSENKYIYYPDAPKLMNNNADYAHWESFSERIEWQCAIEEPVQAEMMNDDDPCGFAA